VFSPMFVAIIIKLRRDGINKHIFLFFILIGMSLSLGGTYFYVITLEDVFMNITACGLLTLFFFVVLFGPIVFIKYLCDLTNRQTSTNVSKEKKGYGKTYATSNRDSNSNVIKENKKIEKSYVVSNQRSNVGVIEENKSGISNYAEVNRVIPDDVYKKASQVLEITYEEAKLNSRKIEEINNCIYIKSPKEPMDAVIINVKTREFLYARSFIDKNDHINAYIEGKRKYDLGDKNSFIVTLN